MELGLFSLLPQRDLSLGAKQVYDDTIDMVRMAEQIGFDVAWIAEHHFGNYSMCPSPLVLASHLAGLTSKIKLGPAVLVLPLYHPLRVLGELGMVDQLSDGRLIVGFGSGYQAFEFERYGVALKENWAVTHEAMDILEMAFDHGRVEYQGKYFQIPETHVAVPMVQSSPRVIIAGNQPEYLHRAARRGYQPIITVGPQPVEAQLAVRTHVAKHYAQEGINDADLPLAISRMIYVTDSMDDARDAAERVLYTARLVMSFRGQYEQLKGIEVQPLPFENEPSLDEVIANMPIGGPERVAEQIVNEVKANRPAHYAVFAQYGGLSGDRARRSLERFGAEVVPLIDKELGGLEAFGPSSTPLAA
ncbi:MAG: LLM class flavin-dependent oxidoreductase [Alphaproteobacteria bacterium]|nr:LLM class flavin-dependent oxidoreductase [Alphaproteobacteria bacterium]